MMIEKAWSFYLYGLITRLLEPFRGSEIMSKLTKGLKNRSEAFCGALRLSVSCSSCTSVTADLFRLANLFQFGTTLAYSFQFSKNQRICSRCPAAIKSSVQSIGSIVRISLNYAQLHASTSRFQITEYRGGTRIKKW
jgi:hypothetical protein